MEEALVSTAGATMSDNAAYGLVGSLTPAAWGRVRLNMSEARTPANGMRAPDLYLQ